jgi:hypothetical protein
VRADKKILQVYTQGKWYDVCTPISGKHRMDAMAPLVSASMGV